MELTIAGAVCLVGVLMYLLAEKPKVAEVGKIMFGVGLLVFLYSVGTSPLFNTVGRR